MRVSKERALELIQGSKGKFITLVFQKKNKEERTINGQYVSTSKLGYVKIKEACKAKRGSKSTIRNVNLQTTSRLKCTGVSYSL